MILKIKDDLNVTSEVKLYSMKNLRLHSVIYIYFFLSKSVQKRICYKDKS